MKRSAGKSYGCPGTVAAVLTPVTVKMLTVLAVTFLSRRAQKVKKEKKAFDAVSM
jgi:hypothetical protein